MIKGAWMKKGFSLAEVLITLGIVGVVSAMTMPVLIANIRHTELESRFKKTTAELQTALQKVQFDEGVTINGHITGDNIAKVLAKQFKTSYLPNKTDIRNGSIKNRELKYKSYNGVTNFSAYNLDDGTIVINDDFFVYINNDVTESWFTNQQIYIDTNGFKKPNRQGYDLFKFCLSEGDKINYNCDTYSQKALTEKDYFKKLPR